MTSHVYKSRRRGVSPIIATLMLVAIAVVGGVVVYTYFTGIANKSQVQSATVHSMQLLGYDARQVNPITNHLGGGISTANNTTAITYIALYIKNNGAQSIEVNRVYVNGTALTFNSGSLQGGQFHIGTTIARGVNTLNVGSTDTLLLRLSNNVASGTSITVVVEVTGGQQFKYDILAGNRVF